MALAHGFFGDVFSAKRWVDSGPFGDMRSGTQGGTQIPIREVGAIDRRHGFIMLCEVMHGVEPEYPQDIQSTIGQIGQWLT